MRKVISDGSQTKANVWREDGSNCVELSSFPIVFLKL